MPSPLASLLCQYSYDPLDELTGQTLGKTPERKRFYCKYRLVTQIQGVTHFSIFQHDELLLAQHRHGENVASETTLVTTDQQRSVLATFRAGQPHHLTAYSPYGHRPVGSGLLSLLGFNGEQRDPVTGCYLLGNGYRAFNPVLMRFNSPDNRSPFDNGGFNAYAYCSADPMNRTDASGHSWKTDLLDNLKKAIPSSMKGERSKTVYRKVRKVIKGVSDEHELLEKTDPGAVGAYAFDTAIKHLKEKNAKINKYYDVLQNPELTPEQFRIKNETKLKWRNDIIDDLEESKKMYLTRSQAPAVVHLESATLTHEVTKQLQGTTEPKTKRDLIRNKSI